jgi:HK97 family phage major capsid protein/HK97 family phage prohead protease
MPYNDYPQAMTDAAKRGIKLNAENGNKCATDAGKRTSRILADRGTISDELLKDMYSYLQRAQTYYDETDETACGTISYLLWGGLAAKRWTEKQWEKMNEDRTVTEDVEINYELVQPQSREAAEAEATKRDCDGVHPCSCGGYVPVQTERSATHTDEQVQQRTHRANFEVREDDNGQPVIRGYAAVFDAPTRIGSFTETIARGAFDEVLDTADVRALFNHDANMILARRHSDGSGTLRLHTDEHGLAYEFTPGNQTYARDLVESMRRGDVNASSFAFTIKEQQWSEDHSTRTVQKVGALLDIAPVVYPAYPQSSASLRHAEVEEPTEEQPTVEAAAENTETNERSTAPEPYTEQTKQTFYNMKNSNDLKELRGKHTAEFEAINAKADADGRNLTEAESQRCDFLNSEILRIDDKLKRALQSEEMTARMAQMGGTSAPADVREAQKVNKSFSIARAAAQIIQGGKLEGAELEWKQEADKEARGSGIHLTGNIAVPEVALRANADDFTTSGDGDGFVGTSVGQAIGSLREPSLIERLGATVITGATGNLKFPRVSAKAVGAWATEVAAGSDATMEMDDLTLTPKRVGAITRYSRQLLIQGGASVDAVISQDIALALNNAIDTAAFSGSGASGQPTGILNTTGVDDQSAATGNTTDLAAMVTAMEAALIANGAADGASYVFSPKAGNLAKLAAQVSSVSGLWDMGNNNVNGYNAVISGYLANASATVGKAVFGNFRQLVLCYFGSGIDILVDPYTLGDNANIKLHANRFVDLAVRQAGAFSICEDIAAT